MKNKFKLEGIYYTQLEFSAFFFLSLPLKWHAIVNIKHVKLSENWILENVEGNISNKKYPTASSTHLSYDKFSSENEFYITHYKKIQAF